MAAKREPGREPRSKAADRREDKRDPRDRAEVNKKKRPTKRGK